MSSERKVIEEATRRVLLKDFLVRESARAGFGGLDIQRTPMGTRVTLICERPGILIGRRGELIKQLTQDIQARFKLDNPQIEVQEERQPSLNAQLMAEKLASTLERGWHFRRAGHSTVRRIMESGARGCQVILSGKLTGERHRTERFKSGMIKYCGEAALVQVQKGFYQARLKPGVIGVNVWIMRPTAKLPDEIRVKGIEERPKVIPAVLPPLEEPGVPLPPIEPAGVVEPPA
jgi:small subunit ribosomal protein S3